jgi:putative ABC transport system substrate-binding protein
MTSAGRRLFGERKRIVELAGKYRLPAIYIQKEFVDEGGLMSYGTDYDDLFRQSAHYVDKKSSRDRSLPTCPFSRRRSLNSSSTSKQRNGLV